MKIKNIPLIEQKFKTKIKDYYFNEYKRELTDQELKDLQNLFLTPDLEINYQTDSNDFDNAIEQVIENNIEIFLLNKEVI